MLSLGKAIQRFTQLDRAASAGESPKDHLARFRGWMHANGRAGLEDRDRSGAVREVASMADVRRKFVDIHRSQGSAIAEEALDRIATLRRRVEPRGLPPNRRAGLRKAHSAPGFMILRPGWPCAISGKSPLAAAIRQRSGRTLASEMTVAWIKKFQLPRPGPPQPGSAIVPARTSWTTLPNSGLLHIPPERR